MTSVWFVRQFRQNGEVDDDAVGKWLDEGWARRAKDLELNVELCIAGRSDIISPAASRMFQHPHRSHCQFHLVPGSAMRSLPFLPGEAGGGTWARGGRRAGERQKKHCTGCGRADGRRKGMCKEERIMGGVER